MVNALNKVMCKRNMQLENVPIRLGNVYYVELRSSNSIINLVDSFGLMQIMHCVNLEIGTCLY